jgi:FkbM family methyltransferase
MADSMERRHYFWGQYYDRPNRLLIEALLRPGDTYIDIGANIGIYSLLASQIVGPTGHVYCFEPHPQTYELLRAHLAINRIINATTYNLALSDHDGELTLYPRGHQSGCSSLLPPTEIASTPTPGASPTPGQSAAPPRIAPAHTVNVRRGDDILSNTPFPGRILLKIDTEGFEQHVLHGLPTLLARNDVTLTVEVTDDWLRRAGGSAQQLFDELKSKGYTAYQLRMRGLISRLHLIPLKDAPPLPQFDAVFARPGVLDRFTAPA